MSKSILVIADEQEVDNFSLEKSHKIAVSLHARLDVLRFLRPLDSQGEALRHKTIQQAQLALDKDINTLFGSDSQATGSVVATDNIADWVVRTCNEKHFDLVVKTGHRTESLFHTPTDWQLMRQLSSPVLIVNKHKWRSEQVVMAAVDLSTREEQHLALNELVLQWTSLLSKALNCSPHIVYSIPIAKYLLAFDVVEKNDYLKKKKPEAEKQLAKLLDHFELNNPHTHITAGPPDKTIPHMANKLKADLVIMGCFGRKGLKGFLVGNTAENVLHHLRTDILIVESSGLESASKS